LTLTTRGDDSKIQQIIKQLNKLVEVVRVEDLCDSDYVERELLLIKVRAEGDARQEVKRTADIFRGQIIDVTVDTYTIQLVGPSNKLDAFIRAIDDVSIVEVVRSGVSGISR
jgi:acetolactate synthase-1/3 small subunit